MLCFVYNVHNQWIRLKVVSIYKARYTISAVFHQYNEMNKPSMFLQFTNSIPCIINTKSLWIKVCQMHKCKCKRSVICESCCISLVSSAICYTNQPISTPPSLTPDPSLTAGSHSAPGETVTPAPTRESIPPKCQLMLCAGSIMMTQHRASISAVSVKWHKIKYWVLNKRWMSSVSRCTVADMNTI